MYDFIYDDHMWWSYVMIMYDDHIWWTYIHDKSHMISHTIMLTYTSFFHVWFTCIITVSFINVCVHDDHIWSTYDHMCEIIWLLTYEITYDFHIWFECITVSFINVCVYDDHMWFNIWSYVWNHMITHIWNHIWFPYMIWM